MRLVLPADHYSTAEYTGVSGCFYFSSALVLCYECPEEQELPVSLPPDEAVDFLRLDHRSQIKLPSVILPLCERV